MGLMEFIFGKKNKTEAVRDVTLTNNDIGHAESKSITREGHQGSATIPQRRNIKVTEKKEIEDNIKLEVIAQKEKKELYCRFYDSIIFCHSFLVDKLGDLTKFIISSLYKGYNCDEIVALTCMGNITIREELEYLVKGGLVEENQEALTELGRQYGSLLEKFAKLSKGIKVGFNTFAMMFEKDEQSKYCMKKESGFELPNEFVHALSLNNNYANSLQIAINELEEEMPFCDAIKKSLYTTVKIKSNSPLYKNVYIKNYEEGLVQSVSEKCLKVVIPCDYIKCTPRYEWLDPYRGEIQLISKLYEMHEDCLSEKAKLIYREVDEETSTEKIEIYVNTITGKIGGKNEGLRQPPSDREALMLERQEVNITLDSKGSGGIYLEEDSREVLYIIRYFTYSQMETRVDEKREGV
ncbi:MAG: hypothetical protein MJ105_06615 [Lachnospiraceae bacterium]|nr:hypothetical protein [Lachnospiraceae bacterium]